jgi:DNA polymerase-4
MKSWPRIIALVDMNAFFASIEQQDFPQLQGRPVGVTNGERGTCIITASYEARAWGVHTGMRLKAARDICPGFIQRPARPRRYAEVSTAIMTALKNLTPDVEVFSVDEAFLDLTRVVAIRKMEPEAVARLVRQAVLDASGITCSVGLSGDKSTAKVAAKQHKPYGLTVVPPHGARDFLAPLPVTDLCGINRGIGGYLEKRGVTRCGDMEKLPVSELGRRFGNIGRRIWFMAQGLDPEPVITEVADPRSIGHGKVMPPETTDEQLICTYMAHMSDKVAARLRKYSLWASTFFFGLRTTPGWLGGKIRTDRTSDQLVIYRACKQFFDSHWHGEGVSQIQITALDPEPALQQLDLFSQPDPKRQQLNRVQDAINSRFGQMQLVPGRLLNRSDMPDVIAPAWKPDGVRQTIE